MSARLLLTAAASLLLAGCNLVVSKEPWIEQRADAPVIKPGVWAALDEPDCKVDQSLPIEQWPKCAGVAVITADGSFYGLKGDGSGWEALAPVLAAGDPVIGQVPMPLDSPVGSGEGPLYLYFALHPTAFDEDGRITAFDTWLVQCGPVDKTSKVQGSFEDALVTKHPFAGLRMTKANCEAESFDALRRAAMLSGELAEGKGSPRWARDVPADFQETVKGST